ncbi:MAG TPA: alpha/beta hydrolase [Candidatus Limnocylindrales bacterium]|jgi:pimeloyl-ACP methyl ester carboxylesterase
MPAPVINTPEHLEHRIKTPDGRTLAVAEWGDPNGIPFISMHGTPGGRITYWEDPTLYARHGLRRLTYDRPGYGESTRLKGRTVADVVIDVEAITAALGIDRFVVAGGSGGGPHCLATAALMPDRVIRCLAEVSIAPYPSEGLDWLDGMTPGNVAEFEAAIKGEEFHRAIAEPDRASMLERLAEGREDFLGDDYIVSEADVAQLRKHMSRVADQFNNALAPGVDGWVDDVLAFVQHWGFDVESIRVPTAVKFGRTDNLVPPAHGDWLSAHIPGAIVDAHQTAGHTGDDADVDRVHAWLSGESSDLSGTA